MRDGSGRTLWSAPYAYDGYPGGLLSEDGTTFAYVSVWYSESEPVVSIYSAKGSIQIPGSAFAVEGVAETASHFVWLESGSPARLSSPGRLELNTLDGDSHVVDTATGKILGR